MMNFKKIIKLKKFFLKIFLFILLTFFLKKLSLAQTSPSGKLDLPDSGYTNEEVVVTIWANHPDGVDFVALKYEDEAKVLKFVKHPDSCNFQKDCERRFSLTWSLEGKYVVCGYFKGKDGILRDTKPDCKEILIEKRVIPPGGIIPPPKLPGVEKPIVIPYPGAPKPGKEAGAPIIKEPQMPTPKEGCEKTKSCKSCPSECVCSCKSSCEKDCKKYEDDLEAYGKCINECKEKASGGILPCNKKYDDPSTRGCDCCPCSLCSLFLLLKRTIDFLFYPLAFALFIISLIISGILFITQGGRPERIKAARNTLTLSCLGFGLILASWVLINTWLGVLTKETEGGIATIFGKRWNQIECPLPKGECTIFQPPLPQRYYCGDGFVIGDEECDPKEPYFRFYLRTKGTINSWFKTLSLCTERCILKCTKIPDLEKIGLRCQDLNNNGKIEPEERCLEGKYVCDPSIGERGKVICADVYADPKWKDHPDYIGKRLGDFCCEFRMPTEEERALATSATKIVPIVDGKVVSCKVACQKIGKICIGIGSYDELNCAYPYSPRSSCCTEPPGGCGYYFCLWAGKGDCDLAGGRLPPGVRLGRPCIDRGEYLAKSKRCDLTTPLRPNYSWCYCL